MTVIRRKSSAISAPKTLEAAQVLVTRYADLLNAAQDIRVNADAAIGEITDHRDAALSPIEQEMATLFQALQSWWSVSALEVTEGKRKSAVIAGYQVGQRTTTPALALPQDRDEDAIIADLLALPDRGQPYLVTQHALYRPALIKALRAGEDGRDYMLLSSGIGLGVSQREEFFIDAACPMAVAQ